MSINLTNQNIIDNLSTLYREISIAFFSIKAKPKSVTLVNPEIQRLAKRIIDLIGTKKEWTEQSGLIDDLKTLEATKQPLMDEAYAIRNRIGAIIQNDTQAKAVVVNNVGLVAIAENDAATVVSSQSFFQKVFSYFF